jgi:hypothetical protein
MMEEEMELMKTTPIEIRQVVDDLTGMGLLTDPIRMVAVDMTKHATVIDLGMVVDSAVTIRQDEQEDFVAE